MIDPRPTSFVRRDLLAASAVLAFGRVEAGAATVLAPFANDVRLPGLLHAVIARPPLPGWRLEGFEAARTAHIRGVVGLVRLDPIGEGGLPGVAVLARDGWSALRGLDALAPRWTPGPDSPTNAKRHAAQMTAKAPFLPPCATAVVREGACRIWACLERPQRVREAAAALLRIPLNGITIMPAAPGPGGFVDPAYALDAARLSQAAGAPVCLVWTRADDLPFSASAAGRSA